MRGPKFWLCHGFLFKSLLRLFSKFSWFSIVCAHGRRVLPAPVAFEWMYMIGPGQRAVSYEQSWHVFLLDESL